MQVLNESDDFRILSDLGLTNNQVRIYLALLKLSCASKAAIVFKASGVTRQDVYRVLSELQQLGIVEKIISKPNKFCAVEPKKAVSILIEKKKANFQELKHKADEFASKAHNRYTPTIHFPEKDQIVLIAEKQSIMLKIQESIEKTQDSVDILTPSREFLQWMVIVEESIKMARNKGVKIRWITKKPNYYQETTKILKYSDQLSQNKRKEIISSSPGSRAQFFIFDEKEIILAFEDGTFVETPVLWTNSPTIIVLARNYFETCWKNEVELQRILDGYYFETVME